MSAFTLQASWPTAQEDLPLGILFHNLKNPEQGFYPQGPAPVDPQDISFVQIFNFNTDDSGSHEFKANAQLTNLIKAYLNRKGTQHTVLRSARAGVYKLLNSEAIFDAIRTQEPARQWINKAVARDRNVYMLVGKQTITDSVFSREVTSSTDGGGGGHMPTSEVLGIPSGGAGDVAADVSVHSSRTAERELQVKDEMIWAFAYRELKFSFFSKTDVDKAQLNDTKTWEFSGVGRGFVEEPEEAQVLEVSLGDEEIFQLSDE